MLVPYSQVKLWIVQHKQLEKLQDFFSQSQSHIIFKRWFLSRKMSLDDFSSGIFGSRHYICPDLYLKSTIMLFDIW